MAFGVLACSTPRGPIERQDSSICTLMAAGECASAPSGNEWCRYASSSCPSGLSWSPEAGDGLAGTCVEPLAGNVDAAVPEDAMTAVDGRPEPDAQPPDAMLPDA